jgi:hypothetical protein
MAIIGPPPDEQMIAKKHFVIVVLPEEIKVREAVFRKRVRDGTEALEEQVFMLSSEPLGLHGPHSIFFLLRWQSFFAGTRSVQLAEWLRRT